MKNKAVVIQSPLNLKVLEVPIGEPQSDEVLIRTKYISLCGSDVKLYQGTYSAPHKYPIIIGHEWVGEIVKAGSRSSESWKAGDIVTGDCSLYCNSCDYCARNDKNHCVSVEKKGITQDGGCVQYMNVKQQHLYCCPNLPDIRTLALAEPLAVSVEAVVNRIPKTDLKKVHNALIIGSGGIGAMAVFMLLEEGIPEITVADVAADKLAIIDSFGFRNIKTVLTDLSDGDVFKNRGFDLIIEAAGSASTLQKAIQLANPCGMVVCIGHQKDIKLDFALVMKKSLTIVTSIGSTGGFEKAIEIIEKHYAKVRKLLTRIITLDEIEKFFATEIGTRNDIKILIALN